jgi:hypothetical protein
MMPAPCATCQRIRVFVTLGLVLIALIYLQPQGAMALARLMPDPVWIGAGLTLAGAVVFVLRLYRSAR